VQKFLIKLNKLSDNIMHIAMIFVQGLNGSVNSRKILLYLPSTKCND
jgi:hypothetical protein